MSKRYFIKGTLSAASQMYDEIKYSTIDVQEVVFVEFSSDNKDAITELIKYLLEKLAKKHLASVANEMLDTTNGNWIVSESSIDITMFQPL
jgi:hypothetical protein